MIATALAIAATYFGPTLCGPPNVIDYPLFPPDVAGVAMPDCTIIVNDSRRMTPGTVCTVVVHEYGHLAGHGHSPDPDNVMHPTFVKVFEPCRAAVGE